MRSAANARGRISSQNVSEFDSSKLEPEGFDTFELSGSIHSWSEADLAAIFPDIASLSTAKALSLRLFVEMPIPDKKEIAVALNRVGELQKQLGDRSSVDLVIETMDTIYPRNDLEKKRVDYLRFATETLRDATVRVRWLFPLHHHLVYQLETFAMEAEHLGAEMQFSEIIPDGISKNDELFIVDFIKYRILEGDGAPFLASDRSFHVRLLSALENGSLDQLIQGVDDQSLSSRKFAQPNTSGLMASLAEAGGVLFDGARAHLHRLRVVPARRNPAVVDKRFNSALLIGAYGGEHIGDAAILGGVLFRLHNRHGLQKAILMSQRPAHTRHLLEMIKTPVDVSVKEYQFGEIDSAIDEVDAVVFAGGPFIDLPKQLVRHLYAATLAKLRAKPFLMEGIGPGPFPRLASKLTAQRIISLADNVTLRTRDNADAEIVEGIEFSIGRDPAFDYLDTRNVAPLEIGNAELKQIEDLLSDADDRPVIGINLRPIYHHYTVGVKDSDKADYTSMVEDRFERRLAEALENFSRQSKRKPIFILFPMNAVQFGLSDLKSAWRLGRHLGEDIDYRVWEADASLDGVVALLRRCDVAITMRFHATIFALSQSVEAIGVDYRIGKRDKVAAVLSDAGKGEQCARIDEMTAEWLENQLSRALATEISGAKLDLAVNKS